MSSPAGSPSPKPLPTRRAPNRADAQAEQRLRLMLAMVDAIGQSGYRATTVADVIGRAGTSRKTFYKHFPNKQECFLAAYDLVSAEVTRRVEVAYRKADGWPGRAEAAIRTLLQSAIENPNALRLMAVEMRGRWDRAP